MGIIARPIKEGGASTYTGKVAIGFDDILAEEFDDEFGLLFGTINGNIDTANLLDFAVTNAKLANGAVTDSKVAAAANISGTKLANNSVSVAKLQSGASVFTRIQGAVSNSTGFAAGDVNALFMTITPRGTHVDITAGLHGHVTVLEDNQVRPLTVTLFRDAPPGGPAALMSQFAKFRTPVGLSNFSHHLSMHVRWTDIGATPGVANGYVLKLTPAPGGMSGEISSTYLHLQEPA